MKPHLISSDFHSASFGLTTWTHLMQSHALHTLQLPISPLLTWAVRVQAEQDSRKHKRGIRTTSYDEVSLQSILERQNQNKNHPWFVMDQELHHNDFQVPVRTTKTKTLRKKNNPGVFIYLWKLFCYLIHPRGCDTVVVTPLVISIPRTVLKALMSTNKEMRIQMR